MNCEEFQQHLISAVEERLPRCSSLDLLDHARDCEAMACRQAWNEFVLLAAIVPVWQASLPDVHLVEGVLNRLGDPGAAPQNSCNATPATLVSIQRPQATPTEGSRTRRFVDREQHAALRSPAAVLCAAACILLLVPLLRLGSTPTIDMAHTESHRSTEVALSSEQPRTPKMRTMHVYAGVPQSATEFVTDAMVMFVPADFSDAEDEAPTRSEQWRVRLGEQLEPLGREFDSAVDALLEVVSQPEQRST